MAADTPGLSPVPGLSPTPGGGWVPVPDPTKLTTEAVEAAGVQFRRELATLREILEARLDAMESATDRRLADVAAAQEQTQESRHREILALRELLESRLAAMDKATELLAATIGKTPSEVEKAVFALRELLSERIDGMDEATKLLATSVQLIPGNIEKSAAALKSVIDTRLAAMDEATKLLATNVDKVPYAILQEAGNLKSFIMSRIDGAEHATAERFAAVEEKFASNGRLLDAALGAQEKAAAEQNRSNSVAISKSEQSTKETIAANAAQAQTGLASLALQLADVKERVVRIESGGSAVAGDRTERRLDLGQLVAVAAVIVAVVTVIVYALKK